jgi:hypothetical protein
LCGFSNASWGSFFADDLGVAILDLSVLIGVEVPAPASICSTLTRFLGDGVGGAFAFFESEAS